MSKVLWDLNKVLQRLRSNAILVIYDDRCGACHKFITLVDYLNNNRKPMEFLSIYECLKQEDLTLHFTLPRDVQTVIVLDRDLNLRKSDAIIHLIKSLGGCWRPLGWGMSLIPLGIRNYFYDKFAKNRYKICKPRY